MSLAYTKFRLKGLSGAWLIAVKLPNIWPLIKGTLTRITLKNLKVQKHVKDVEYKAGTQEEGETPNSANRKIFKVLKHVLEK